MAVQHCNIAAVHQTSNSLFCHLSRCWGSQQCRQCSLAWGSSAGQQSALQHSGVGHWCRTVVYRMLSSALAGGITVRFLHCTAGASLHTLQGWHCTLQQGKPSQENGSSLSDNVHIIVTLSPPALLEIYGYFLP